MTRYRMTPAPRLVLDRAKRESLDPIDRVAERYEHLLLGSLSVRFQQPAEPAPPAPESAAQPADESVSDAPEMTGTDPVEHTRHMARVFTPEAIAEAHELLGPKPANSREVATYIRSVSCLDRAGRDDGWRSVPWAGPDAVADPFAGLGAEFTNFGEVLMHLSTQWTLARRARSAADARIEPILLTGEPGVGKTYFAATLAELIGVRMQVFSAGGAQDAMQLCGSDARWSNTRPGIVFDLLAQGDFAAPVLVVDEIDKIAQESTGSRDTPINTLLDLFEEDSARRYRDMSLQLEMDAGKVIVIATANDRERISPPLLSRLTEFHIKAPSLEQRRLILEGYLAALLEAHECSADMTLDEASAEAALATPDLDVRALLRMVRAAFAAALAADSDRVVLSPPRRGAVKRRIGFV
jgi:ATP-dependent Lon protease